MAKSKKQTRQKEEEIPEEENLNELDGQGADGNGPADAGQEEPTPADEWEDKFHMVGEDGPEVIIEPEEEQETEPARAEPRKSGNGPKIGIKNKSTHPVPEYQSDQASGMDIRANLDRNFIRLSPGQRKLVPTGIHLDLPEGVEAQVRPRSGLAYEKGITVLNAPGTIDADYKGEVMVNLINLSGHEQMVKDGERIAQLVFARCEKVDLEDRNLKDFTKSARGDKGHGSSGS